MFNTEQFAYKDITVMIGATVLTGVQSVRYKRTTEKELIYGKGNNPQAIQHGNITYDGEIKVLQSELEALINAAPNGNLDQMKNLIVTITYDKLADGGTLVTDQLVGVEFTEVEKMMEQTGKYMTVTLPILFLGVRYNV